MWDHIHFVTKQKEKKEKHIPPSRNKLWAWGTLAELHLMKPMTTARDSLETEILASQKEAKNYCRLIKDSGDNEVIDSTKRQLNRYISWWPEMFAEYPLRLKVMAMEICKELLSAESLIEKHVVS